MAKVSARHVKLIAAYHATLKDFAFQYALHEGAVSTAFQTLLTEAGRSHHWTLIPQLTTKGIRPDGTMKDFMNLVRGHWEAKDTKDDLDVEIAKKTKKGYPLTNIIFEDTREAVLYQNKQPVMRVDLQNVEQTSALLDAFFSFIEPQIDSFEKAVQEFKERVPDIAKHLKAKIEEAHRGNGLTGTERVVPNPKFNAAFATFMDVCRSALNPTITEEAVDDMLVQHLLTERLIREIFDNPEFTRRNVIAAEIEKVIAALTSRSFDRNVFLKSLDRFYVAIENAARTITEWSDKQHFLNTIYERFFQGYNVNLADTMGIVYTPQPIVDFMCASVVEVLEKEFGRSLGDPGVNILDPCTGTGNFIVNLLRRVPKKDLQRVYREQLFANEIMLLPYYIAALNIEHAYYEQTGEYEPFEGLCFVDTLDLAEAKQAEMSFMTARNTERVERQKRTPITVVIGNPPYNTGQEDENDGNRNRKYSVVDERICETFVKDGTATLRMQLYDPYVRFFRWAIDRLEDRDGIVCLVTNNSFVDQRSFDGMRKWIAKEFAKVYHIDLHGDVRRNQGLSGTTHNVFGIQVGVGITVAIKRSGGASPAVFYHRVPEEWRREVKLAALAERKSVAAGPWVHLALMDSSRWIVPEGADEFAAFAPLGSKDEKRKGSSAAAVFQTFSAGPKSNGDVYCYDFDIARIHIRATRMIEAFNSELDRWKRSGEPKDLDGFLRVDERVLKWVRNTKRTLLRGKHMSFNESAIRHSLYRPFTKLEYFADRAFNEDVYQFPRILPTAKEELENRIICCTNHQQIPFIVQLTNLLPNEGLGGRAGQCFPFYIYDEDGSNRRENITDWSLAQFRTQYKDDAITKWDVFHYVYGLLHHPGYRTKFADNLKRELPRIPFAPDFRAFATAGQTLATLHLDYETLEPWPLKWIEQPGVPLSYRVEKMKLIKPKAIAAAPAEAAPPLFKGKRKAKAVEAAPVDEHGTCRLIVNPSLTLAGIPLRALDYRLGNRSALEWVVDQYQVSEDKRSKIVSDPNHDDDEQYIVRLVGQVVRVSMETMDVVDALPAAFGDTEGESA